MHTTIPDYRHWLKIAVRAGFDTREAMICSAYDYAQKSGEQISERDVAQLTDRLLAEHHEAQPYWHPTTDWDRLDAAFVALDKEGIFARHNVPCCQSCGYHHIIGEMAATQKDNWLGYVFYHEGDTEAAIEGRDFYLSFGVAPEASASAITIGQRIVAALHRAGLRTCWDGEPYHRIHLTPFHWQRRR